MADEIGSKKLLVHLGNTFHHSSFIDLPYSANSVCQRKLKILVGAFDDIQ